MDELNPAPRRKDNRSDIDAELLRMISTALIEEGRVENFFDKLVDVAVAITGADFASIQRLETDRGELQLLAFRGFSAEAATFWKWVRIDSESTCGIALRRGTRVIAPDVERHDFLSSSPDLLMYLETGIHAVQSTPLVSRTGEIVGMISTHWRKTHYPSDHELRLVDILARQAADLIERSRAEQAMRTREEEFRAAIAELEEANRLKDYFLATLSHELRTPLNAVLGWSHMLRDGALPPEAQRRALDSLIRNATAQVQLVNDLLDVSRIDSGMLHIQQESVDLRAIITLAADTVRPTADAKQIELQLPTDVHTPVLVRGDADRLRQVMWNLLQNAIKFTPSCGRVSVDLRMGSRAAEIIVTDTGRGISSEFLPHVFERFRQADTEHAMTPGGLGLGLAIVQRLVEAHGGTVYAASQGEGRGATFVVRLPIWT